MTRARICVAIPAYTCEVHVRLLESLTAAWMYCLYHGVELELKVAARFSLVQYARNYLVQQFLDDDSYTHLMWLDSDLGFDPRAIMQLLDHDKDVVGGVYPVKSFPTWFPYEAAGDGEHRNRLHKAKMLPNGFMLCKREAVQAVADKAPRFTLTHAGQEFDTAHIFDLVLEDARLLGEDLIFCRKLQDAGFDVWADPDIDFRHCGMMEWGGNLARTIESEAQKGSAQLKADVSKIVRSDAA